jgi:hypothetical protein
MSKLKDKRKKKRKYYNNSALNKNRLNEKCKKSKNVSNIGGKDNPVDQKLLVSQSTLMEFYP